MTHDAKVLFVDDEERIVKLLRFMFQTTYQVFTATSPTAALDIVRQHDIDVVVSDQRMPEMTGIVLLAQVREISPHSVRILLTGYSDLVAIIGAVNDSEVYRFLNKPWDKQELTHTLVEAVGQAQAQRRAMQPASAALQHDAAPTGEDAASPMQRDGMHPLAAAAKLLALDGVASDCHEVMEMFTDDYDVLGASSIAEALEILTHHHIGVVVANAVVQNERTAELLAAIKRHAPSIMAVVLTDMADSDMVVDMINRAQIYRFAIKPILPNVFRLAVSAAMREHHRLCADPSLGYPASAVDVAADGTVNNADMVRRIVESLSRFTEVKSTPNALGR